MRRRMPTATAEEMPSRRRRRRHGRAAFFRRTTTAKTTTAGPVPLSLSSSLLLLLILTTTTIMGATTSFVVVGSGSSSPSSTGRRMMGWPPSPSTSTGSPSQLWLSSDPKVVATLESNDDDDDDENDCLLRGGNSYSNPNVTVTLVAASPPPRTLAARATAAVPTANGATATTRTAEPNATSPTLCVSSSTTFASSSSSNSTGVIDADPTYELMLEAPHYSAAGVNEETKKRSSDESGDGGSKMADLLTTVPERASTMATPTGTGATTPPATAVSSIVLLNIVAVLWGTQHAVIKSIVNVGDASAAAAAAAVEGIVNADGSGMGTVGPAFFTLARFLLAASAATMGIVAASSWTTFPNDDNEVDIADKPSERTAAVTPFLLVDMNTLRWGLEMGVYMFLGFAFQAIGLQYTTASKSGFLLYLNVKFVPLLAYLLWGRPLTLTTIGSALAAFVGTSLLATNGQFDTSNINIGDLWSVMAALASAMFILRLEQASAQVPNAATLNAASLWTVTLLSFVWWTTCTGHDDTSVQGMWHDALRDMSALVHARLPELLYLGVVATAVTNWIQTIAQRDVPAERASIIYAMDPVYGALFAHLWLGENLDGSAAWIGAALIVAAAATNALLLDLPSSSATSRADCGTESGDATSTDTTKA